MILVLQVTLGELEATGIVLDLLNTKIHYTK